MTEPTKVPPNPAVANIFRNIVELLKHGMFFGHNAGYVQEAIGFLEANIKAMTPEEPATLGAEGLKAVPNEQ